MGYEVYPSWWNGHWLLKWKTPATHHNMHHEYFEGNYGLYFTWWDRWMGTEFKEYNNRYQHLFTRPQVPDGTKPVSVDRRPSAVDKQADSREPASPVVLAQADLYLPDGQQSMLVTPNETLLAAALRQRIAVPYACQRGRCGTCQARCVQGRVRSHTVGPLSIAQQQAGYFLMCQSYADSARLTITYTTPAQQ
jgi:ferredoxin